ncbi:uncharacterized protein BDV14DRAFT_103927 [Aspergillus stella-maris]|uniref:uncharacterized protein n=1 Tax=Aspergillus stella-maris TaxID=1810926 RepID=UPI003CCD2D2D
MPLSYLSFLHDSLLFLIAPVPIGKYLGPSIDASVISKYTLRQARAPRAAQYRSKHIAGCYLSTFAFNTVLVPCILSFLTLGLKPIGNRSRAQSAIQTMTSPKSMWTT